MRVYTLGYEGLSLEEFLACLHAQGVRTLVDVRQLALSRKRGFSKTTLARALQAASIEYVPMHELGCPKPLRQAHRAGLAWADYVRAYNEHLEGQHDALSRLVEIATEGSSCLMCYEADAQRCHRSIVAEALPVRAPALMVHHLVGIKVAVPVE